MDVCGGSTGDRGFHRDWWRSGDAFVELESAGVVWMAANYLLAGPRAVRSLPDSFRRPWYACAWLSSLQFLAARGRALGEDDAGGEGAMPPGYARLRRRANDAAGFAAESLMSCGFAATQCGKAPPFRRGPIN